MAYEIITSYNQLSKTIGTGYDYRPNGTRPGSIIVHTTNGNRGSTLAGEATFLINSPAVSAHFLIGKLGEILLLLPAAWRAWHAGAAIAGFLNSQSIGIECHHAVGEPWTDAQRRALTWLVQKLMADHNIPAHMVETHRAVALPAGRKIDPSDWPDTAFYAWRAGLKPTTAPADAQVIGVAPSITLDQFTASLTRNKAPLSIGEIARVYQVAAWLEIDPAFLIGLWAAEGGRPFGGSTLQQASRCPINVRAAGDEWRPTVEYNDSPWLAFESVQLGWLASLVHLKNIHGWAGRLSLSSIIPIHAPADDGNDPPAIIASILQDMTYVRAH
jgi:hypothetical protein